MTKSSKKRFMNLWVFESFSFSVFESLRYHAGEYFTRMVNQRSAKPTNGQRSQFLLIRDFTLEFTFADPIVYLNISHDFVDGFEVQGDAERIAGSGAAER